jgi:hypothetical protein
LTGAVQEARQRIEAERENARRNIAGWSRQAARARARGLDTSEIEAWIEAEEATIRRLTRELLTVTRDEAAARTRWGDQARRVGDAKGDE